MCMECGPLIKAIDAYIQKADDGLADALGAEGYIKPKKALKYAQDIEDSVAEALLEETDYILAEAEKAVDLETFAADIWPGVKLNDAAKSKLATVFTERLGEFLPEYIGYYIAQTDRGLKLTQVSKRTLAWVKSWSKDLGEIMQLNSHKEIERILEKGLAEGSGITEFTRAILDSGIRDEYYKARRVAIYAVPSGQREDVETHGGIQERAAPKSCGHGRPARPGWGAVRAYRRGRRHLRADVPPRHHPPAGGKHKLPLHFPARRQRGNPRPPVGGAPAATAGGNRRYGR